MPPLKRRTAKTKKAKDPDDLDEDNTAVPGSKRKAPPTKVPDTLREAGAVDRLLVKIRDNDPKKTWKEISTEIENLLSVKTSYITIRKRYNKIKVQTFKPSLPDIYCPDLG